MSKVDTVKVNDENRDSFVVPVPEPDGLCREHFNR
jgi:hypothetical protein